jgi:hypothetical protein
MGGKFCLPIRNCRTIYTCAQKNVCNYEPIAKLTREVDLLAE